MFHKKFGHLLFCINFTPKFQTHTLLLGTDINRLRWCLLRKSALTNGWHNNQVKPLAQSLNGAQIRYNRIWKS